MGSLCSSSEYLLTVAVLVGKAVELSLSRVQIQSTTTEDSTARVDVGP